MLAASLSLTVMLAGCSSNKTEEKSPSASSTQPTASSASASPTASGSIPSDKEFKIKLMSWHGGEEQYGPAYNNAFEAYMKLHPNVKIEHLYQPNANNGYTKLLDTQFVSHEAPDAMMLPNQDAAKYANQDYLLTLDGYLQLPSAYNSDQATWLDTFKGGENSFSSAKSGNKYGAIIMIPVDGGPGSSPLIPFYYNKDIFDKAGITEVPETWAELLEACQKIKDLGIDPVAADGNRFLQWMDAFSGYQLEPGHVANLFDEKYRIKEMKVDLRRVAIATGMYKADDPVEAASLDLMKEFSQYWQQGWAAINEDQAKQIFLLGKAAIYMDGNWDYSYFEKNIKGFTFDVMPFPVITKETTPFASEMLPVAGDQQSGGWGLNKDLEKDEEKLKVVLDIFQFLTSKENQQTMSDEGVFVPVVNNVDVTSKIQAFIATDKNKIASNQLNEVPLFNESTDGKAILQLWLTGQADKAATMNKLHEQAVNNVKKKIVEALDNEVGVPSQIKTLEAQLEELNSTNAPENVKKATEDSLAVAKLKLEFYQQFADAAK
ncbi:ABC transporter substrate-binding protein [Cohnella fermenti]|uniref:ABC transporter substrate-binding protein n=1 Tax=Cohnella fermenti TaxID=2565925 RepID=UPI001454CEFA|nr:extracellular solute-binding protein [Cohnella fermenti]